MSAHTYKYDLALSLCKEDVDFARKLVAELNPGLSIFFYEDKQEELITKSGPEAFATIFKSEARIVIILSRKEWSETFYTDIEKNAILERIQKGYDFLMIIPIKRGEVPPWYPSTKIYASPERFNFEQLARFIEFKVTDEGGYIRPVTPEIVASRFRERAIARQELIASQFSKIALEALRDELINFRNIFNNQLQTVQKSKPDGYAEWREFYPNSERANYQLSEHKIEVVIHDLTRNPNFIFTSTQQIKIAVSLRKIEEYGDDKVLYSQTYRYLFSESGGGWCIPNEFGRLTDEQEKYLYFNPNNSKFHQLSAPITSKELVEELFIKLLLETEKNIIGLQ